MDCTNAEKLLPLYVRADLETNSHSSISSHLQLCPQCRQLADEYKDSQRWMRLYEPPEFSEEFFADIRHNVLSAIREKPAARWNFGTWLEGLMARPLGQRMIITASAALLIISSAVALYISGIKSEAVQQRAAEVSIRDQNINGETVEPGQKVPGVYGLTRPPEPKSRSLMSGKKKSSAIPVAFKRSLHRIEQSVPQNSRETQDAARLPVPVEAAPTQIAQVPAATSNRSGPLETENSVRVEFQTKNPNIQVIWFIPNGKQSTAN